MKISLPILPDTSLTDHVSIHKVVIPSAALRQRPFDMYTGAPASMAQASHTVQLVFPTPSPLPPRSYLARCPDEIQLQILKAASLSPIALLELAQIDSLRIQNSASDNVLWAPFFPKPTDDSQGLRDSICRAFAQRFAQMDVNAQSVLQGLWDNDATARDIVLYEHAARSGYGAEPHHGTQIDTSSRATNTVYDMGQAFALFHHAGTQDLRFEDFSSEIRANKEAMLFFLERHHAPMEIVSVAPLSLCCDMQFARLALKRAPKAIDYLGKTQRKSSAMRAMVGLGPWLPVARRGLNPTEAAMAAMLERFFDVRDLYLEKYDELQNEMRA